MEFSACETPILSSLVTPSDVAKLGETRLIALAAELRNVIVSTVSRTGGHLAPSLGVVELTLALLTAFDPARDRLIWDVGHQSYAYKLLTGRLEAFHTLRQYGGMCGFPTPRESEYDHFGVGHSSTSISAALGMAFARDLAGDDNHVVAVIGDGSMTAGLAYEGLNQAGDAGKKLIVVLNDNEMSISKNVGALSFFLSRGLSAPWVRRTKKEVEGLLSSIPKIGPDLRELAIKGHHSLKGFLTPGMLFEAFRFNYMGPVDGHNLNEITKALETAKQVDKPVLVHVITRKGKGYAPAEENPVHFHGVGKFAPETGAISGDKPESAPPSYTRVFGETLEEMAERDERVIAITAAMPEGTGLSGFGKKFPERFMDVGICEQHAVTFAAGLAIRGYKPFVAIYSTFLQRSYDQVVHDVCIQNLPVTFCVDRAGLVGEDGATHQGAFDIAFLRHIPNMAIIAPKDENELRRALYTALEHRGPLAIRYPRGQAVGVPSEANAAPLPFGELACLMKGDGKTVLVAAGPIAYEALAAAKMYAEETGETPSVYNSAWIKPLPEKNIIELAKTAKTMFLLEEGSLAGGFSSGVLELLADNGPFPALTIRRIGLADAFVEHGAADILREKCGLTAGGILRSLRGNLSKPQKNR